MLEPPQNNPQLVPRSHLGEKGQVDNTKLEKDTSCHPQLQEKTDDGGTFNEGRGDRGSALPYIYLQISLPLRGCIVCASPTLTLAKRDARQQSDRTIGRQTYCTTCTTGARTCAALNRTVEESSQPSILGSTAHSFTRAYTKRGTNLTRIHAVEEKAGVFSKHLPLAAQPLVSTAHARVTHPYRTIAARTPQGRATGAWETACVGRRQAGSTAGTTEDACMGRV